MVTNAPARQICWGKLIPLGNNAIRQIPLKDTTEPTPSGGGACYEALQMRVRWLLLLAFAALPLARPALAHAHGVGRGSTLRASDLPPSALKRQILDVERRVKEQGQRPELVKQPLAEAIRAAERARSARVSGDARHGGMLEKLGEQWVSVAKELLRAAELEKKAAVEARRARDLVIKVDRAEALLVEQHARIGRLGTQVKGLDNKVKDDANRTKVEERDRVAPKPKPPTKKERP
jgi:hypothetical protein